MTRRKDNFEDSAHRHEAAEIAKKNHEESDWKEVVDIGEESIEHKAKLIKTLEKHAKMWDGHLGLIHATEHRIELTPNADSRSSTTVSSRTNATRT